MKQKPISHYETLLNDLENTHNRIKQAYRELWSAVENDTLDKDFFALREQFRSLMH